MSDQWGEQRSQLTEATREMYRRGLVGAYSGNTSLRLSGSGADGLLLVTPTHHPYYRLEPEELVVVDLEGEPVEEGGMAPSSETRVHLEIYRNRDDVQAVVHTHSIYASVASVVGRDIPALIDEMLLTIGGPVKVSKYAFPGTQQLAEEAYAALGNRNAALLRNHGVVSVGPDIWEALEVADLVERLAQIFVHARNFGPRAATTLPEDAIATEMEMFRSSH
ncbi:MAG: class II aldolase/adducin family protein [Chloroflexi bacterium]|nr:class II aldolase/adducin family protein [Chloroflexota bacterium]